MTKPLIDKIIFDYKSGLSMDKVAEKNNVSAWNVNQTLIKNNIPKRSFKEASKLQLQHKDNIVLSDRNKELLIGNLMSDGSVLKKKKRAFYTHTDKNKEYLIWTKKQLEEDGITFSPIYQNKTTGYWVLQSHTFMIFNKYRDWFYPKGKRILPEDIKLTPTILKHWYLGDGSVATYGGRFISRLTGNPENLLNQLKELFGEEVSYQSRGFYIPVKYVHDFLNYIGNSPTENYEYKWRKV